ncbi:hypothetical protein BH23CHL4_BH23CHL4_27010 [soil metagenome]
MSRISLLPAALARSSRTIFLVMIAMLAMALAPMLPARPVAAASGAITIEHYLCPDDFDAESAVFGDLDANCTTPGANETFSLLPSGGAASDMVTNASGIVSWPSSDPGTGTITQVDAGTFASTVWCSVHEDGVLGTINFIASPGNAISYNIPDGQLMDCAWFNSSTLVVVQGSEIALQKWVCPPDYDYDIAVAAPLDELSPSCTDAGATYPFVRIPDGGDPVELSTDDTGYLFWPEFPFGAGIVAEPSAQFTSSRVFCSFYDIDILGEANYSEFPAPGNQINYDLASGQGLSCEWFNIPVPPDTSDVNIFKRACPEGDWSEADLAALTLECVDPHADVTFSIGSLSSEFESTTDGSGSAGASVPSGDTYFIAESTPEGYGPARVYCSNYDQNVGPGEYTEMESPGNAIESPLDLGFSLECYWFNLPAETGTIEVSKFECPQGYGTATGYDALISNCQTPLGGVTFTLDPEDADAVEADTDASGEIAINSVPLGQGTLAEQVPQGYNWVEVYCSIDDGQYQAQNISAQNVMGYEMESGQFWSCSWFNLTLEAGPASLTINKYTCQTAHDPIEPNQTLANECAEPTEDITFTLAGGAGAASASTGEGGAPATIRFSELEPGTYLLTEEIPDNVRMAYISECRSDVRAFSYPFYPFAVIEADGRINVELLPGEDLECDWYNVLEETPGTITIIKYWCQGNVVNAQSCEIYTGGIAFTLIPQDGGEEIALLTGNDGAATTEAEGIYEIVEDDFEWCSAQSNAADANGNIVVESGQQVEVEIFNCGPQPILGGS